jgi:hypothetical protein
VMGVGGICKLQFATRYPSRYFLLETLLP